MECNLFCQICCTTHKKPFSFKEHLRSEKHQKTLQDLFPTVTIHRGALKAYLPHIVFVNLRNSDLKQPVVGLSLLTLCFSPRSSFSFYLCHVCEAKVPMESILDHICSKEHCFNYFVYTNPDDVSFAWKPDMDMKSILWEKIKRESRKNELQKLQVLHLPGLVLDKLRSSTYLEVMGTLDEKGKLVERFEAMHQNRVSLQGYHSNTNRKHPLLGLQHIVECVCLEPRGTKYYLCTLCCLVMPNHMITKHVLSFDHLHRYFKEWHPSTLNSKVSYKEYSDFAHIVLDLAKQAEEIHAAENISMQQVNLQPDDFKSVNFKSYPQALKSLESIINGSLTITVEPGNKLEHRSASPSTETLKCWLRCQNCSSCFRNIHKYFIHLTEASHIETMQESALEAERSYGKQGNFYVGIYPYVSYCLKSNKPPVGTSLVVTCLTSVADAEPFYLCFACEDSFCQSTLKDHFQSRKHLINTQLHYNPWQLPFGWESDLDEKALRWTAWKEEEKRRNKVILKIFDIPYSTFHELDHSDYKQVLHSLEMDNDAFKQKVPQSSTYYKPQQNEKFPFLGLQFLVEHNVSIRPNELEVGGLCLLCERRLDKKEIEAHFFSREHVSKFLDCFHPGSLDSHTVNTETLLDLAKQAAKLHPVSNKQIIYLEKPIWEPCTYHKAKNILSAAKLKMENEHLVPPIKPKWKLVPRNPPNDANRKNETGDKKTCPVTVQEDCPSSGKETASREEKVGSEKTGSQKLSPNDLKDEGEKDLSVKLKTEEPMTEEPRKKVSESSKDAKKEKDALTKEESSSIQPDTTRMKECHQKSERKRSRSPEQSSNDSRESECKISLKRKRLTSKDDSCFEESTEISNLCTAAETTDTAQEEDEHKCVMDKVLRTCIEWRCDKQESIYLCGHCSMKISKEDITSHVKGGDHPKMFNLVVHLREEMYGRISKQSFQSASLHKFLYKVIKTVERPNPWLDSESSLTSFQTCVSHNGASAEINNQQELEDKVMQVSSECGATVAKCKPGQGKPFPGSNKESKDGRNNAGSSLQSPKSKCKANISPSQTKSLTIETATKPKQLGAVPTTSSNETVKSVTASCRTTEVASTTSKTSTPQSPTSSMPPKSQTNTDSKETCTPTSSATAGASGTQKPEHPLKCTNVKFRAPEPPKTKETSSPTSKTAEHQVKNINSEARTLMGGNSDTETAAHKRKLPASSHQNPEETKKPRKDPCPLYPNKTVPKVGLNQLVVVSCEGKQQVYCLLCSVKLNLSSHYHLTSNVHQYKYVKLKYPEWSAKNPENLLNHTVAQLAIVEKTLPHTRSPQKLKVEKDEYQKLGNLPDNLAVERVKALVKQRDLQASSSPTVDSTKYPCHDISSPCDVSSSGIPAFNEMSESADWNQPEEENNYQHQTSLDQISETECVNEDDPTQAVGQSVMVISSDEEEELQVDDDPETLMQTDPQEIFDQCTQAEDMEESETILKSAEMHREAELQRHQNSSSKDMEAHNQIQHQRQSVSSDNIITDPVSDSETDDITETFQLDPFKVQDDDQPQPKVKLSTEGLGLTLKMTHKSVDHLLTAETQHCQSDAAFQEPQKAVECEKKASGVQVRSFELGVASGQQKRSELSHKSEPAPKLHTRSEELCTSWPNSPSWSGRRAQGSSHLSYFLKVAKQDPTQVIGMGCVWECQGIRLKTFFLCEICEKMLSAKDICQHIVSHDHHLKFLGKEDQRFLEMFWLLKDLPLEFKMDVLNMVVQFLSFREQYYQLDAWCILLGSELHEYVRTSPFSEALKIVKSIIHGQSMLPLPTDLQRSERHQSAGQKPQKSHSEEASLADCLDERTSRKDTNSSSSKTDNVVFPDRFAGPHVSHPEACSGPAQQPEFKTAILQLKENPSPSDVKSSTSNIDSVVPLRSTVDIDLSQEPSGDSLQLDDKSPVLQVEETPAPLELNATYSKANSVSLSSVNPSQETHSGSSPLQPEVKPEVSQLRRNSSSPDLDSCVSVADLVSSCSVSLVQPTFSVPSQQPQCAVAVPQLLNSDVVQLSESTSADNPDLEVSIREELPLTKARPADSLMENLFKSSLSVQEPPVAKCVEAPNTFESESSSMSVLSSSSVNPVMERTASVGSNDWEIISKLISMLKKTNHSPSASNTTESKELIQVNNPTDVSKGNAIVPTAALRDPQRLETNIPLDICRIRNPDPSETGINPLPINTIITPRSNYIRQTQIDRNRHNLLRFNSDPSPGPTNSVAASEGINPYTQAAYLPNAQPGFAQSLFPVNTLSIYQQYSYPSQAYPQQLANPAGMHSFEYSLTTQMPLGWSNLDMQQYYMMQRPESDQ